jgi:hypothetical protein
MHLENLKIATIKSAGKNSHCNCHPSTNSQGNLSQHPWVLFFQKKKIHLQNHPLFVKNFFKETFLKRSHSCWLRRMPWLWGQVAAIAMAIVARAFNSGDPNYVYPSCKVNVWEHAQG